MRSCLQMDKSSHSMKRYFFYDGWIKMAHGMDVGLGSGHIVLDRDPAPPPKKGQSPPPNFRPISIVAKRLNGSRCHSLGTEVGLGPGDIVLDGDPVPPKRAQPPILGPRLLWPNCQTAVCIRIPHDTEVGLSLGDIVLDGDPAPAPLKGHSSPIFGPCPLWPNGWMD